MSALQDKYKALIDAANSSGVTNLQITEQDGVLHITGESPSGEVKDKLWSIYNSIDPNFLSGDVVMDVNVTEAASGGKVKVVTESTSLNIRKGPGTDQPIVGKAAHDEVITLISKTDDQWSLVRTDGGVEGYVFNSYIQAV